MSNGMWIELPWDVDYDYQPAEAMVKYPNEAAYPGCDASLEVGSISRRTTKKVAGELLEDIIRQINSAKEYVDIDITDLLTDEEVGAVERTCWDEVERERTPEDFY